MSTINKHTAVIDGVTFTRDSSSGRVYTHCIVIKVLVADERAEVAKRSRNLHTDSMRYESEVLAGAHKTDRERLYRLNRTFSSKGSTEAELQEKDRESNRRADAMDAKRLADAQEYVKTTTDERVKADVAEYDAKIAASKQLSPDRCYHYLGGSEWCGRPDLAEKAVANWFKRGEKAIAVPATYVVHTPKARKAK